MSRPHKREKSIDVNRFPKTVYKAYPDAIMAKSPVKKTVAPMPTYLLNSVGACFKMRSSQPEQKIKKAANRSIILKF